MEKKPETDNTRLLEKVWSKVPLSREEKDRVASILYGTFSSHTSTYKLMGWAWVMSYSLKRILVSFTYDEGVFRTFYAPDKTSLRKVLSSVAEMIEPKQEVL
jgi:hypothetical protein